MLKQLKIAKALELKREQLKTLETKAADILKRSEDTTAALTEAATQEDLTLLETEIENIEKEQTDLDSEKKTVEDEIAALEEELEDVKERSTKANKEQKRTAKVKGAGEE